MLSQQDLANNIREIPPLKDVVIEAQQLLEDPGCDFRQVEKTISRDLALTTRVLSVANSSFFAIDVQVNSIKDAFLRLGIDSIRNIVTSAGVLARFPGNGGELLNHNKLWEHNLAVGVAARVMAREIGLDAEQAFTAGLLHDIGKFVLDLNFPKFYEKVIDYQKQNQCSLLKAERSVMGVDHTQAGSQLAQRWNIADDIEESIRNHHSPDETESRLTLVIHMANRIAKSENIGFGGDRFVMPLSFDVLERLSFSESTIEDLMPTIRIEIQHTRALIVG